MGLCYLALPGNASVLRVGCGLQLVEIVPIWLNGAILGSTMQAENSLWIVHRPLCPRHREQSQAHSEATLQRDGWAVREEATGRLRALWAKRGGMCPVQSCPRPASLLPHPQCPQQELRTPHREPPGPVQSPAYRSLSPGRWEGTASPEHPLRAKRLACPCSHPPKGVTEKEMEAQATNHGVAGWGPEPGSLREQGLRFTQGPSTDHSLRVLG